nr:hypothetical protein [Lactobacillus helveticus]
MIGLNFWNHLLGDVRYLSWAVEPAVTFTVAAGSTASNAIKAKLTSLAPEIVVKTVVITGAVVIAQVFSASPAPY